MWIHIVLVPGNPGILRLCPFCLVRGTSPLSHVTFSTSSTVSLTPRCLEGERL